MSTYEFRFVSNTETCSVCVEVAYELLDWQQAFNKSYVERVWASFLSDIELKLQILMEPINFNINFRGVIPINVRVKLSIISQLQFDKMFLTFSRTLLIHFPIRKTNKSI